MIPMTESRMDRVFHYQPVDRFPDVEFGFWPQTIRRWLGEGLPLELTPEETNDSFSTKISEFFGIDTDDFFYFSLNPEMHPAFEEKIYEVREESVIMRDASGTILEKFRDSSDLSSIPHFIEFPIKTPADWEKLKERYVIDDPARTITNERISMMRKAQSEGKSLHFSLNGFYGQMRNWMGMENLSCAFYDYPEMIHEMVEVWAELCVRQIEKLPDDISVNWLEWWEDMAGKNGPLISPAMFKRFIQPRYQYVMEKACNRGCTLSKVDSDGDPEILVPLWLEVNVNIMFPLEISAGVDPGMWRKKFGKELRLQGGIAKRPLIEGGSAIDRELERVRPLIEDGGYIPHLDHLVPPDVSLKNYSEYREKKQKLIGK